MGNDGANALHERDYASVGDEVSVKHPFPREFSGKRRETFTVRLSPYSRRVALPDAAGCTGSAAAPACVNLDVNRSLRALKQGTPTQRLMRNLMRPASGRRARSPPSYSPE
jgi:hypothetical protein